MNAECRFCIDFWGVCVFGLIAFNDELIPISFFSVKRSSSIPNVWRCSNVCDVFVCWKYDISIKDWNKTNIALFWSVLQYVLCSCTSGIDGFYTFLYLSSSINLINYIWVFIWLLKWNLDMFWKPQILHSNPFKIGGESSEQGA